MRVLARTRFFPRVLAIFVLLACVAPLHAQQPRPVDPDANAVSEQMLLEQARRIEGWVAIPNETAAVLMQPAGRTWRYFHEVVLRWTGTIAILGMILLLGIAYLVVGRLRISAGRSGAKVLRFTAFERFSHWLTATSFVLLGLTGLNITFGKLVLLPVIGPDAFTTLSEVAKYVHTFSASRSSSGSFLLLRCG